MKVSEDEGCGAPRPGGNGRGAPAQGGWPEGLLRGVARPGYDTLRSASAGRIREARQPPMAPAISPPAMARPAASAMVVTETGADSATSMVFLAAEAACPPG